MFFSLSLALVLSSEFLTAFWLMQQKYLKIPLRPRAKKIVLLTHSAWPTECPTFPAHSVAYGGNVWPMVQIVV